MTTSEDIEIAFVREFSIAGNLISRTRKKAERRERVRHAIYENDRADEPFFDHGITYAEAFRRCYGERLDRRAAIRALPDTEDDVADKDLGDTNEA